MARKTSNEQMRKRLWPDVAEAELWLSNRRTGFSQVPRGLSLVNRIIDRLSVGKPLSNVYFALWCNLFDNAVVRIDNATTSSFEAGFSGPRAVTTWKSRMRILADLGLIKIAPGPSGEFGAVLMLDPYKAIANLKKNGRLTELEVEFNALMDKFDKSNPSEPAEPTIPATNTLAPSVTNTVPF